MKPQVLLTFSPKTPPVAGASPGLRTAFLFQNGMQADRILLCGASPSELSAWMERMRPLPWVAVAPCTSPSSLLSPGRPLLWFPPGAMPRKESLEGFIRSAGAGRRPVAALRGGKVAAVYYPDAAAVPELLDAPPAAGQFCADDWDLVDTQADAAAAEAALLSSLPQDSDGYLARWDRRVSIGVSRRLMRLRVTPNQITTLSLLLGLLGAWWLGTGGYPLQVAGAALLWACCILDGCDGEVARLKLMSSSSGARYDVIADHASHLAVFLALPLHLHRKDPAASFLVPGALLASGVLLSMFWVWWLILRRDAAKAGGRRVFERVASRDYVYLIALFTLAGKLEWFLWGAAVGSHLFWAGLLAFCALEPHEASAAAEAS